MQQWVHTADCAAQSTQEGSCAAVCASAAPGPVPHPFSCNTAASKGPPCCVVTSLNAEEKDRLLADENNRGYTPFAEETLDPEHQTRGDTKEGFYFGR